MRIFSVNGSPRGRAGNTDVMVRAFLEGARRAGAETQSAYLADVKIGHCRACHSCWSEPGGCVLEDDMAGILSRMAGADLIVLATPVQLGNVSGMLKVFVDRLTVTGSPHAPKGEGGGRKPAEFVLVSSCGYPDKRSFDVVTHWVRMLAAMMGTRVAAEVLAAQGKLLAAPEGGRTERVTEFLEAVARAGAEVASGGKVADSTAAVLERGPA